MVERIVKTTQVLNTSVKPLNTPKAGDFASVLSKEINQIHFSSHAKNRISSRGIVMDQKKIESLNQAVNLAASKGAKESLVLLDDLAMVVSVTNRTVITAFQRNESNIFTNIDSAVIV